MDCSSIPAASVQDVVPVPELVDGPLDEFPDEFVTCWRQKAAQTYVVSIIISFLYPPSEQSETGRYTVFTFVCLCVCVSMRTQSRLWKIMTSSLHVVLRKIHFL